MNSGMALTTNGFNVQPMLFLVTEIVMVLLGLAAAMNADEFRSARHTPVSNFLVDNPSRLVTFSIGSKVLLSIGFSLIGATVLAPISLAPFFISGVICPCLLDGLAFVATGVLLFSLAAAVAYIIDLVSHLHPGIGTCFANGSFPIPSGYVIVEFIEGLGFSALIASSFLTFVNGVSEVAYSGSLFRFSLELVSPVCIFLVPGGGPVSGALYAMAFFPPGRSTALYTGESISVSHKKNLLLQQVARGDFESTIHIATGAMFTCRHALETCLRLPGLLVAQL